MRALGPGAKIADRYVLESVIAKGGMGAVYRAIDERLGRTVAIKVLLHELAEDQTSIARFEREAAVSAKLTHPAIVQMFDFGKHDGIAYIVMELVVGRTLAQELDDKKRIEPSRACDIIEQALGGIGAAHEAGIVHRDLKPGNIMLIPTGTGREVVKVLDFGIAQLKDSAPYVRLTKSGAVLGTPTFMAPEQARGETCGPATDVYAMGVVLWCCLTGVRPFQGPDVPTVLGKVLNEMPPRADVIDPSIPPAIAHATERAMEKRPSARYPTAAAFAQALMEAVEASSIPATSAVSLPPESRASQPPDNTRPVPAMSASGGFGGSVTREIAPAAPVTRELPPAPARPSATRWIVLVVAIAVTLGVALGVLAIAGVVELERGGADLGGMASPLVAPTLPTPAPAPVLPRVVVQPGTGQVGPDDGVCAQLYACCNAFRDRVRPSFPDCDGFVGQLQGDPASCASRITMFQDLARDEGGGVQLPECGAN